MEMEQQKKKRSDCKNEFEGTRKRVLIHIHQAIWRINEYIIEQVAHHSTFIITSYMR